MQKIFCVTSVTSSYFSIILLYIFDYLFLSGKTKRMWLNFKKGCQIKLKVCHIWRLRDIVVQYSCTAGLVTQYSYIGDPAAVDCLRYCTTGTAAAQDMSGELEELSTLYLACHLCSPLFFFCAHDRCDNMYVLAEAWQSLHKGYGHSLPEVLLKAFAVWPRQGPVLSTLGQGLRQINHRPVS